MGVARLRGGGVGVATPYLPLPPPLYPRIPVAPGAYWTLRWRGGGGGGEDRGIVGPPSPPFPLVPPRTKKAPGEGWERGG